jgi:hypothetical protein
VPAASQVEAPAIIHIAGPVCGFGSVWRQRCQWCGGLIEERDLSRIAVIETDRPPERQGQPLDVEEFGWWDGLVAMAGTFPAMTWAVDADEFYDDGTPKVAPRMCMVLLPDEMTTAPEQSDWPAHLRDDAPSQTCSVCSRKTWDPEQFNRRCGMLQPNGDHCSGMFR